MQVHDIEAFFGSYRVAPHGIFITTGADGRLTGACHVLYLLFALCLGMGMSIIMARWVCLWPSPTTTPKHQNRGRLRGVRERGAGAGRDAGHEQADAHQPLDRPFPRTSSSLLNPTTAALARVCVGCTHSIHSHAVHTTSPPTHTRDRPPRATSTAPRCTAPSRGRAPGSAPSTPPCPWYVLWGVVGSGWLYGPNYNPNPSLDPPLHTDVRADEGSPHVRVGERPLPVLQGPEGHRPLHLPRRRRAGHRCVYLHVCVDGVNR